MIVQGTSVGLDVHADRVRHFWHHRSPQVQKLLIIGSVGLIALAAIVFAVLLIHRKPACTDAGAPLNAATPDDWFAPVCRPGSFRSGPASDAYSGATTSGSCIPPTSGYRIFIGEFDSSFLADNAEGASPGPYATLTTRTGDIWVFHSYGGPKDGPTLQPLQKFGFTIHQQ